MSDEEVVGEGVRQRPPYEAPARVNVALDVLEMMIGEDVVPSSHAAAVHRAACDTLVRYMSGEHGFEDRILLVRRRRRPPRQKQPAKRPK